MQKISSKQKIILIIFGLLLFVVLLEIGLRIGGFVFLSLQEYRNRISIKQRGTYRIMCLGESHTALGGKNSYPSQLEEVLNQQNIGIKFSVINKGIPGTNTGIIVSQLEDNLNKYTPDMVMTMMGLNDGGNTIAYEDIPVKKTTLFLKSFRMYKLLKLLHQHIINKAQEIGIYKPRNKKEDVIVRTNDLTQPGNFKGREEMFKKAIELNPGNDGAYINLGLCYREQGKYDQAVEMFKKAIGIKPGKVDAYIELGWCYSAQGKCDQAVEMFKKVIGIGINPEKVDVYIELGRCYNNQGERGKAEEIFKKAIELNPKDSGAYIELGWCYSRQGKYGQAREMLKKAIEINPKDVEPYFGLGRCYKAQEKYEQAEEIFKKAIEIDPENVELYNGLAICYEEQGKNKSAEEYFKKANRLRLEYYNSVTRRNYQRLKEIVTQREIRLVCVQYPMRDVEPLKKMLRPHDGIIFVNNEMVFKEAVKQAIYDEYFMDMCRGDFGHCTRKGNRLLAENIADVILKECFKKGLNDG